MFRMAYVQGAHDAVAKYAGMGGDAFRSMLASPNLKRNLNVAGLGLLAVPVAHSLATDEDATSMDRAKHVAELAGLGLLTRTEFMKH